MPASTASEPLRTVNPANGEPLTEYPVHEKADVERILDGAKPAAE